MSSGSLKTFDVGNRSAEALAEGTQKYFDWLMEDSLSAQKLGEDEPKKKASPSDWMDLIGSAGMVMGGIKKTDGDQGKLVVTVQNSSPHVIVPREFELPNDQFYATSYLTIMTPGDNSEADFNVNGSFDYSDGEEFFFHFTVVASNGKYTACYLLFDCINGNNFVPKRFSIDGYGDDLSFPDSDRSDDTTYSMNYVVAAEGIDDNPSFALSMVKVVVDAEDGVSKVGIVLTPWKVGTVSPVSGFFQFPSSGKDGPALYADLHDGAVDAGKMAWNYVFRNKGNSAATQQMTAVSGVGVPSPTVGGMASFVTMGVNLLMGAHNLFRKDKTAKNLVVKVKNMTPYTFVVSMLARTHQSYIDNSLIRPHDEGTVNMGTKDFSNTSKDDTDRPGLHLSVSDGRGTNNTFEVMFADTTHDGFSGHIRVMSLNQNGKKVTDTDGFSHNCKKLDPSCYKSMEMGPEFIMMSNAISNGNDSELCLMFLA